ncbi:hypothetical protein BHM03_00057910 [Ensete ventricosum]|nr:hypothetical protein BHM03_00057910 [Ensete ventricosum]
MYGHGQPPCRGGQLQPRPPCKGAAGCGQAPCKGRPPAGTTGCGQLTRGGCSWRLCKGATASGQPARASRQRPALPPAGVAIAPWSGGCQLSPA